jgi:hypothetical protein
MAQREDQQPPWRISADEFLRAFKYAMEYFPQDLKWGGKKDWREDLGSLGLTEALARGIIQRDLTTAHVLHGPESDDEHSDGSVVIFKYPVPGNGVAYVKLGLRPHGQTKNRLIPKIWSFKRST